MVSACMDHGSCIYSEGSIYLGGVERKNPKSSYHSPTFKSLNLYIPYNSTTVIYGIFHSIRSYLQINHLTNPHSFKLHAHAPQTPTPTRRRVDRRRKLPRVPLKLHNNMRLLQPNMRRSPYPRLPNPRARHLHHATPRGLA